MTRLHFSLLAFFLSFPFTLASKEAPPHIIIAADHSASMVRNGNIELQTKAIVDSVNLYTLACSNVTVSYIPWGYRPADPIVFTIRDTAGARSFTDHLTNHLRWLVLDQTVHQYAMDSAITQAASIEASTTAIVFITDDFGTSVDYALPDNVSLIKISLGEQKVSEYMNDRFMPQVGEHYHARDANQLGEIIKQVFGDLAGLCIG